MVNVMVSTKNMTRNEWLSPINPIFRVYFFVHNYSIHHWKSIRYHRKLILGVIKQLMYE